MKSIKEIAEKFNKKVGNVTVFKEEVQNNIYILPGSIDIEL